MKATLIIPYPQINGLPPIHRAALSLPLAVNTNSPSSHYGLGVLTTASGDIVDGHCFRVWRDRIGAQIVTDDPKRVAGALGVPWQPCFQEDGIVFDEGL